MVAAVLWLVPGRYLPWDTRDFPAVDTAQLSPTQARVVELLRRAHQEQHPGTYYSEGVEQPWCANLVSWVMREAGAPLKNPHSGHWRIPGVYTLQEYYQGQGRFEAAGNGYQPQVGDVVLYSNSRWGGQHTNIIVAVDGSQAVTVGGNEARRVRVHDLHWQSDPAVVGFGRLDGSAR